MRRNLKKKQKKNRLSPDFETESVLDERKMFSLAILAPVHVEGQVFFSCLASPSGFLKDAMSVHLKQRLLACVKRRLPLYIRLPFIFFWPFRFWVCFSYRAFLFLMYYEQVLMFLFVELTIYFESKCFVQKVLYEKVWIHTCTNIQFITRL